MLSVCADFFARVFQRWMPDSFLFAILLTFVVFLLGMGFQQQTALQMVDHWGGGFWSLLAFSMQVLFTLISGHVLAQAPAVRRLLTALVAPVSTPAQAIVLVTAIALCCSWISWAFGLVCGALVAKQIARKVRQVHYPLLVASAYSGFVIWHAGLSGSIPLVIASTEAGAMSAVLNGAVIPVSETIFSGPVLTIGLVLLLSLPVVNLLMLPRLSSNWRPLPIENIVDKEPVIAPATNEERTPAEKINNSQIMSLLLGGLGLAYLLQYFSAGGGLTLNIINLSFLTAGILLHKKPSHYLRALNESAHTSAGIILQFPLYAGIMGMMVGSGLAVAISQWFVAISTPETFPILTFLSAGAVNFFVPSGGGQWAVQAPIVIPAANALGVPLNIAAMSVAFGDAWTNLIQPFWTLPLLAIAGLQLKDIMGYCTICLLWSGIVFCGGLWIWVQF